MTFRLHEKTTAVVAETDVPTPSRLARVRRRALSILSVSLLGLVVGAPAALAAIGFVDAILWLNELLLVSAYARVQYSATPLVIIFATLATPTLGGLVVGLIVQRWLKERRALGPPDAILAVQTRERLPPLKSGLASSLAALLSLGCGASVGQYGPLVYLGALVGGLAARLERQVSDLGGIAIACGVAAAITVTGAAGADTINISSVDSANSFTGIAGSPVITGGIGNDTITGSAFGDIILGDDDADSISGGGGDDTILGGDGHDELFGDSGVDLLAGNGGDDTLDGGAGSDFFSYEGTSQGSDRISEASDADSDTIFFDSFGAAVTISRSSGSRRVGRPDRLAACGGYYRMFPPDAFSVPRAGLLRRSQLPISA